MKIKIHSFAQPVYITVKPARTQTLVSLVNHLSTIDNIMLQLKIAIVKQVTTQMELTNSV